jgi:hypothetical protein
MAAEKVVTAPRRVGPLFVALSPVIARSMTVTSVLATTWLTPLLAVTTAV